MNSTLSKAATLLGFNGELTNLNVKNLNSLRKLAKTLGCKEDELIENLCSKTNERKSRINIIQNKFKTNKQSNSIYNECILNNTTTTTTTETTTTTTALNASKRKIVLDRDDNLGFGFIAGSERPLVVRFVSKEGPSHKKLLAGDEILEINGENVERSSRESVIQLMKTSPNNRLELVVKQPTPLNENSVLLTENKKALKKRLYKEVRFSLDDTNLDYSREDDIHRCLSIEMPTKQDSTSTRDSQSNKIFKVFLENQTTKSFKYDTNTKVADVLASLRDKCNIRCIEYYGLCLRLNFDSAAKWIMLNETQTLQDVITLYYDRYSQFQCYLRLIFVPKDLEIFMYKDAQSFSYLFEQSRNDVLNDRFGGELTYESILHLASLNILLEYTAPSQQLTSSMLSLSSSSNKSTHKLNAKYVESEWSLERFLPSSLLTSPLLKKKEVKRLLNQNLEWFLKKQFINRDELKLEYLKCLSAAHVLMGRIFLVTLLDATKRESMLIIGAQCGLSLFTNLKSKSLKTLTNFESIESITTAWQSDRLIRVDLHLDNPTDDNHNDTQRTLSLGFLREDFLTFLYLLQGYMRAFVYPIKNSLCPIHEIKSKIFDSLNTPAYLVKHPNSSKETACVSLNEQGQLQVEKKVIDAEPQSNTTCFTPTTLVSTCLNSDNVPSCSYENESSKKCAKSQISKLKSASENQLSENKCLRQQLHDELMERIRQRVKILKPAFTMNYDDIKLIDDTSTTTDNDENQEASLDNEELNLKLIYDASSNNKNQKSSISPVSPQNLIYESISNFNESFSSYDVKAMIKSSSLNLNTNFSLADFNYSDLDVIDLTNVNVFPKLNNIVIAPPPSQFSDRECDSIRLNDIEIESGIESDSTSSDVDKQRQRFSTQLIINLDGTREHIDEHSLKKGATILSSSEIPQVFRRSNSFRSSELKSLKNLIAKKSSNFTPINENRPTSTPSQTPLLLPTFKHLKLNSNQHQCPKRSQSINTVLPSPQLPSKKRTMALVVVEEPQQQIDGILIGKIQNESSASSLNYHQAIDAQVESLNLSSSESTNSVTNESITSGISMSKCKLPQRDIDCKLGSPSPGSLTKQNEQLKQQRPLMYNCEDVNVSPLLSLKSSFKNGNWRNIYEKFMNKRSKSHSIEDRNRLDSLIAIRQLNTSGSIRNLRSSAIYSDSEVVVVNERKVSLNDVVYDVLNKPLIPGALKKPGSLRERSSSRTPLKVRWKDIADTKMSTTTIEFSNECDFDKEMKQKINEMSDLVASFKSDHELSDEDFYEKVHTDVDALLNELNCTIEHVRVTSSSTLTQDDWKSQEIETNFEEKKNEMAEICKKFVNDSKNIISSSITTDTCGTKSQVRAYITSGMSSIGLLICECLEITYLNLFKNGKLDETKQILIQLLSLTNTFRTTLNITYLSSTQQLKNNNNNNNYVSLLMKQATYLANDISLLIKYFKSLF